MIVARRYMVAGNWKKNGSLKANSELMAGIIARIAEFKDIDVLVCPPHVYLESVHRLIGTAPVLLGGQNLSQLTQPGAYTGEVLGSMLVDVGCSHVIVGHSERRALYGEDDATAARKLVAARHCGLVPIFCVGETLEEREQNRTEEVLARQLGAPISLAGISTFAHVVVAYEPVLAIGTGRTATPQQAQDAHAFLRGQLRAHDAKIADSTRILYGGSVKADNADALFGQADVDGGLIGGASLKAADFLAICSAAQSQTAC